MATYSLTELYSLAIAEGQGYGTCYEYLTKLRLIEAFVKGKHIQTVLIYGLPEKYGHSLDFVYFCTKNKLEVFVFEQVKRVKELKKALKGLNLTRPKTIEVIDRNYDLILSSEYLQQFSQRSRRETATQIKNNCKYAVIFVPNKENPSHRKKSGLKAISLRRLRAMFGDVERSGFIDMPFFGPGSRLRKSRRSPNSLLLMALILWSYFEAIFPAFIKRRCSHICYAAINNSLARW